MQDADGRAGTRAPTEWTELLAALHAAGDVVFGNELLDTPQKRAEGCRYLTRLTNMASLIMVEAADPRYPQFARPETPLMQWAMPCPDYDYWQAPVHGDYEYRFRGRRGTARMFAAEIYTGGYERLAEQSILSSRAHGIDGSGDLEVGPDGSFEVVLSRRPHEGNWLELPDGPGYLFVRDAYYDWTTEEPSSYTIERVGATYPPPPVSAEDLAAGLGRLRGFLDHATPRLFGGAGMHYRAPADAMPFLDMGSGASELYFANQFYGRGHFRCSPDEAVVISLTPPDCMFWDIQVATDTWESFDWHQRQTSLNGHQVVPDSDGVIRVVVSHRDPGVPNWLDPAGHERGLLVCRFNRPTEAKRPEEPRVRTIGFADLRDELPADTATMTPEERSESIRQRMLSVRRRRADG